MRFDLRSHARMLLLVSISFHFSYCLGIAEEECRAAGNWLEKMELDGALGWSWGAKDRW